VPEEGGDRFEAHAAVDRLGGQGVAQLVGVDTDAGVAGNSADDSSDKVTVEGAAVVGDETAMVADVVEVGGGPVSEQGDEFGVQGDVAVVAQFADGDAQPVAVADEHDGVGVEVAQLTGAQPGAGEDFDDEPVAGVGGGAGGGHQSGGVAVVEELGQRLGARWDVAADDRVTRRGVGPVPFDEPFEEHAQHPQPLALGVLCQALAAHAGPVSEPQLEVLDVASGDVGDAAHLGVFEQPSGELPQHQIGRIDTVRGEERG
jgi:hypothetical protein